MTRSRFLDIHRNLTVCMPTAPKQLRNYQMIEWIVERFNYISKLHWVCGPNNVIDDQLVAEGAPCPYFKSGGGRKSAKSGICHDVIMNGQWAWNIHVHRSPIEATWKEGQIVENRVNLSLATLPPSKWMRVWLDRAYTSFRIIKSLHQRNFYFICTFKPGTSKWLFKDGLLSPTLQAGQSDFALSPDGIVAFAWHDSTVVCFMTNMVDPRSSVFYDTGKPIQYSMPGSGAPDALGLDSKGYVKWPERTPHRSGGLFWVPAVADVCFCIFLII